MSTDSAITEGEVENDSVKLQLFRKTLETIIKNICKDINESVIEEYCRKLLIISPCFKSKIQQCFEKFVESEMKNILNDFIEQECINEKFQELQKIEENSTSRNLIWRPSGNCKDDICSHDYAQKMQLKAELKTLVEKEELETEKLREKVQSARKELCDLQNNISLFKKVTSKSLLNDVNIRNMQKKMLDNLACVKLLDI